MADRRQLDHHTLAMIGLIGTEFGRWHNDNVYGAVLMTVVTLNHTSS